MKRSEEAVGRRAKMIQRLKGERPMSVIRGKAVVTRTSQK